MGVLACEPWLGVRVWSLTGSRRDRSLLATQAGHRPKHSPQAPGPDAVDPTCRHLMERVVMRRGDTATAWPQPESDRRATDSRFQGKSRATRNVGMAPWRHVPKLGLARPESRRFGLGAGPRTFGLGNARLPLPRNGRQAASRRASSSLTLTNHDLQSDTRPGTSMRRARVPDRPIRLQLRSPVFHARRREDPCSLRAKGGIVEDRPPEHFP